MPSPVGPLRLAAIPPPRIEPSTQQRQAIGRAAATIHPALAGLQPLGTIAITGGTVAEHPVTRVKRVHEPHGHTRCLTPAAADRLLDACNPPLKPVVMAALQAGCRQSQWRARRGADGDIRRRLVTVQAADAKAREPRSRPLDAILVQTLETWPRADDSQALVFGDHEITHTCRRAAGSSVVTRLPHAQFLWSGRTLAGEPVRIDREYIGHGLRARAAELIDLYE